MPYKEGLCSIIVPVHNRSEYIAAALESAWNQTYRPLELIVIDDGSTDSSPQVVSEWISDHHNDPSFQVIFHCQENRGACAARNHGLMLSKGEFVQWLDDDDILYPKKIEKQVKYLVAHPEIDIVACNLDYLDAELRYITRSNIREPLDNELVHHYIIRQDIVGYAPVYRKKILLNVGGWGVGIPCGQDNDLHARLAISGARFSVLGDVLGGVRCHNKGRLVSAVRFSRNKEAYYYDVQSYKRIITYAKANDKLDPVFLNLIVSRLRKSARVYFSKCMPKRASICLAFARNLCPEIITSLDRFYESRAGRYIAVVIEFLNFNIRRLARFTSKWNPSK